MKTITSKLILAFIICFISARSYSQAGTLDSSFGINGKLFIPFSKNAYGVDLATTDDNKIYVAGQVLTEAYGYQMYISRLNSSGAIDTTLYQKGAFTTNKYYGIFPHSIKLQQDGKLVTAGATKDGNSSQDFGVQRFFTDGLADYTFGGLGDFGYVRTEFTLFLENFCNDIAIQNDGKIVAAGGARVSNIYTNNNYALARYKTNGTLDSTFGTDGKVVTNFDNVESSIQFVKIQSDGKIIVAGLVYYSGPVCVLVRYFPTGKVDSTFGVNGKQFINAFQDCTGMELTGDSKIVIGNAAGKVMRTYANGKIDSSFGTNGVASMTYPTYFQVYSMSTQLDGKIILVGHANYDPSLEDSLAVCRFTNTGKPDLSFGKNGQTYTDFGGYYDIGKKIISQKDGKILVVGDAVVNGKYNIFVARYKGDADVNVSLQKNISVTEGNSGTLTPATFTISLSKAATKQVKVNYHTRNLSAKSGSDYVAKSNTLAFAPGVISKTITVNVKGDNTVENNERFALVITDPINAVLGTSDSVICIIRNDDPSFSKTGDVEEIKASSIRLYPNPVKDELKIEGLNANTKTTITIIDVKGDIIYSSETIGGMFTISVRDLKAGTYFLRIEDSNKIKQTFKFIKL